MSDVQSKRKVAKPQQRKFLGKTENFENKDEKRFFQRMLKAYLAGRKTFNYGFETVMGQRQPVEHMVLQHNGKIGV